MRMSFKDVPVRKPTNSNHTLTCRFSNNLLMSPIQVNILTGYCNYKSTTRILYSLKLEGQDTEILHHVSIC
jgi:hypothetical protein